MTLARRHEDVFEDLKAQLSLVAGNSPVSELGPVYEQVEECLKALACCHLLRNADTAKFQNNLVWAALARREFLDRCQVERNLSDHRRARSRSEAVFAALAAGDLALALEVGDLSPMDWIRDGEYEDDFAYHWLVHLLAKNSDAGALQRAFDAYERALDDGPGERLAVCRALCTKDSAAFEEAFPALVAAQAARMDEARAGDEAIDTFEPQSRLFIEGFALLRLADTQGISPASPGYPPLCDSLARLAPLPVRPDDIFVELR